MPEQSPVLFVTRYYWPELIGSAPFSTDIAEWLAAHGRPATVVTALPYYPHDEVFPAYRGDRCRRETVCGVDILRLGVGPPRATSAMARMANEAEFLLRGLIDLARGRLRQDRAQGARTAGRASGKNRARRPCASSGGA